MEYVSKKLGKETIRQVNNSRNVGGKGGGGSMSYNVTGRDLMTPDEISRMSTSDCILFIRGELPFFGKKYDYPKHPNYEMTGDANDDFLFDVTREFNTSVSGVKKSSAYAEEKRRIKIMNEKAETLHSEKIERMQRERREKLRKHSAKGETLYEAKPAEEVIVKQFAEIAKENNTNTLIAEEHMPEVVESFTPSMDQAFGGFAEPEEIEAMIGAAEETQEHESSFTVESEDFGSFGNFESEDYDYGVDDIYSPDENSGYSG